MLPAQQITVVTNGVGGEVSREGMYSSLHVNLPLKYNKSKNKDHVERKILKYELHKIGERKVKTLTKN